MVGGYKWGCMVDVLNPFISVKASTKGVSINNLPKEAWTILSGGEATDKRAELYRLVWALYRGVEIRRNALASMPFAIYKGKREFDTSGEYQNKTGLMPNPARVFGMLEMALTIWSYAYFEIGRNMVNRPKDLYYLLPSSVHPIMDEANGLTGFERRLANRTVKFSPDEVLYFWGADPYVEFGPPRSSPVQAASAAAGVMLNIDQFAATFFERGAIKGTMLAVDGNPPPAEKERIKSWWQRMFGRGNKTAWGEAVINAKSVTPVVVGEGLESLANKDLTQEKREAVASALGIPHSMLFSNASNYATAQEDKLTFYESTIIPECRFIESVLNEQLFTPLGLRFKFTEENLDVFQEDENERSAAAKTFLDLMNECPTYEVFMGICATYGFEIAPELEKAAQAFYSQKQERAEAVQQNVNNPQPPQLEQAGNPAQEANEEREELRKWERKQIKHAKAGKAGAVTFESAVIPLSLQGAIAGALEGAKSEKEIHAIFESVWRGYP